MTTPFAGTIAGPLVRFLAPIPAAVGFAMAAGAAFAAQAPMTVEDALRADIGALTAPETEGRETGTPGAAAARRHLISELAAIGAVPLPGRSDFEHRFTFISGVLDEGSSIQAGGHRRLLGDRVRALAFSEPGEARGDLFFAGYGITTPGEDGGGGAGYDSYAGHDVEGRVVLVFRYFPESANDELRQRLSRYAGLRFKARNARERGAVGMIVMTGPNSPNAGEFVGDSFDAAAPGGQGIVAASVNGDGAEALFAGAPMSLQEAQDALDGGDPTAAAFALPGSAVVRVDLSRSRSPGVNVAAVLPDRDGGVEPPYVIVGAHYDHLGMGGPNSLAGANEMHPGADDNASGTSAVLAIARAAAAEPLARPLVAAFWSGEEAGLLGSRAFVRDEEIAPADLLAYVNLDMVGRMEDNRLVVQSMGSSSAWPGLVERANIRAGFDLALSDDPHLPTDSAEFHGAGVPTLNLFTGTHPDYHRPSDTADRINIPDLARVSRFGETIARRVASGFEDDGERPDFVNVERSAPEGPGRVATRAWTGTIPEYASEAEGLLLGGVMAGGPAEAAGLRKGDLIVEFAGQTILNIYDYMGALGAIKVGEPVLVAYLRDGERRETTLVPAARP